MGELTATLAHEVNQPIAAASINANVCLRLLKREEPDMEEACKAASRMVGDVKRAAEIITRVRQFFRKGSLLREPVDLNELIRGMIVILRNEVTQHSVGSADGIGGRSASGDGGPCAVAAGSDEPDDQRH